MRSSPFDELTYMALNKTLSLRYAATLGWLGRASMNMRRLRPNYQIIEPISKSLVSLD